MDPAEIEFLAEKESIEIVPNFSHPVMHLIQGIKLFILFLFLFLHFLPRRRWTVQAWTDGDGASVACRQPETEAEVPPGHPVLAGCGEAGGG